MLHRGPVYLHRQHLRLIAHLLRTWGLGGGWEALPCYRLPPFPAAPSLPGLTTGPQLIFDELLTRDQGKTAPISPGQPHFFPCGARKWARGYLGNVTFGLYGRLSHESA